MARIAEPPIADRSVLGCFSWRVCWFPHARRIPTISSALWRSISIMVARFRFAAAIRETGWPA